MFSIPVMRALSAYNIAYAALPATNAYMSFMPTADAAKQKQFTLHIPLGLIKPGAQTVFAAGDGLSTNFVAVQLSPTGQLDFVLMSGGVYVGRRTTTRTLQDYSGFYFVTLVMDTPNATALDRMRVYFDLTRETDFATTTNPAQNLATSVFAANVHNFLKLDYAANYGDVYLGGNTCLIGQVLEPSNFLDLDLGTGNVKAKDLTPLSPEYLFMFENGANMGETRGYYSANLRTVGSAIGNMTAYGGLAAGYDGVTSQANTSCAALVAADTYIGRSWGASKTITRFRVYSPNNEGFNASGADVEFRFYGSNTLPTHPIDGVLLLTSGAQTYSVPTSVYDSDTDGTLITTTGYAYHWVTMQTLGTVSTQYIAELEMFEAGTFGINQATVSGTLNQVTSTPTNVYDTMNPLAQSVGQTLSNGNCTMTYNSGGGYPVNYTTFNPEGKKGYFEFVSANNDYHLNFDSTLLNPMNLTYSSVGAYFMNFGEGAIRKGIGVASSIIASGYLSLPAVNERCACAFDFTNGKRDVWFRNAAGWGSRGGVGDPAAGTNPGLTIADLTDQKYNIGLTVCAVSTVSTLYASDVDFVYIPPTGFKSLCTNNLPVQTGDINDHFKAVLYTGTSSIQSIATGLASTDFVWIKSRNNTASHMLYDAARAAGNRINTDSTSAEANHTDTLTAFTSTGFDLGADATTVSVNGSGYTYTAWCASLPNTKTSGWAGSPDITPSKEIYNATLGMSVVTGTKGLATQTCPHSLGSTPKMIAIKNFDAVGNWTVHHASLGFGNILQLNTTSGAIAGTYITAADATTFTFNTGVIPDTHRFVAYIFAETEFCKIGSYIGNGSADGPMINNGISPVWQLLKSVTTARSWPIYDSVRSAFNPVDDRLDADSIAAEFVAALDVDFLSTGVKHRSADIDGNQSAVTYVYLMFGQPNGPIENTAR